MSVISIVINILESSKIFLKLESDDPKKITKKIENDITRSLISSILGAVYIGYLQ